ncbi:MAG: hypothetical protein ACLQGP_34570 [Isosphaeraceae bacterium]
MKEDIDRDFPELAAAGYQITSEVTIIYNCIAWAIGDTSRWWECDEEGPIDVPGVYWPTGAKYGFTLEALISAYETRGYSICQNVAHEEGFEKLALYAENGEWRHAAKQLNDGRWSSKLGELEDVIHANPEDVSGRCYGRVACLMRRRIQDNARPVHPALPI